MMGLVPETRPVNWLTVSQKYDISINEEGIIELLLGS